MKLKQALGQENVKILLLIKDYKLHSSGTWVKSIVNGKNIDFDETSFKRKNLPCNNVMDSIKDIMISEITQSEKDKYHMLLLICKIHRTI